MKQSSSFRCFRYIKSNQLSLKLNTNNNNNKKCISKQEPLFNVDSCWEDETNDAFAFNTLSKSIDEASSFSESHPSPISTKTKHSKLIINKDSPSFPSYSIEFAYQVSKKQDLTHEMNLLLEYKMKNPHVENNLDISSWVGESYEISEMESTLISKHFIKFMETVENDPESIIRYQFGGNPVWYSHPMIPTKCLQCGSRRVFEYQVMNPILNILGIQHSVSLVDDGMDFGTLLVFVCENDCFVGNDGCWREDEVVVQGEFS
jgi:hypothetical protein